MDSLLFNCTCRRLERKSAKINNMIYIYPPTAASMRWFLFKKWKEVNIVVCNIKKQTDS